jgi:beta-glucosidase
VLESLRDRMGPDTQITYARGCEVTGNDRSGFAKAVEAAGKADAVVMVMGGVSGWGKCGTTGEGIDSVNVGYFGIQEDLIKGISCQGKPVIVVEISSRPISSEWTNGHIPAILHFGAPGAYGGQAVADVLLGRAVPSGKLPFTVARHLGQVPVYYNHTGGSAYDDNSIGFNADGYCDMTKRPLYYFGHGLSYTTFAYSDLRLNADALPTDGSAEISFTVKNTGSRRGAETAQLYIRKMLASVMQPVQQLAAFEKVWLDPGEAAEIAFTLSSNQLGHYDRTMRYVVEPGPLALQIGSSSRDIRLKAKLEITGGQPREMLKERAFFAKSIVKRRSSASR